jgi:anti-sigma B factor antagonist
MMLTISRRDIGDVIVLECSGRITLGEGSATLRDTLRDVARAQDRIVLNLGSISYIDGSGIAQLVSEYTRIANKGGQLKLCNVPKRVRDLLQITKLYTVFEVFENDQAAVQSFPGA